MNLMEASPNRSTFHSHLVHQSMANAQVSIATLNYPSVDAFDTITIKPTSTIGENFTFTIENVDTTYHGIYATEYFDSEYLFLGVNQSRKDVLFRINNNYETTAQTIIGDSTVVGLCIKNSNLYFSYRNRRIKPSGLLIN